jgi:hypothetical protein
MNGIKTISFSDYRALDRVNIHALTHLEKSPLHFKHSVTTYSDPTPAMRFGTACHIAALEPDRFCDLVVCEPMDINKKTKAGREEYAAWLASLDDEVVVISDEDYQRVLDVRDALYQHPVVRKCLSVPGQSECTALFSRAGVDCKARIDRLPGDELPVVFDLKTAQNASPADFAKACVNFKYHYQADFYLHAVRALGIDKRHFIIGVVESQPPHGVAVYELNNEAMAHAQARVDALLEQYRTCQDWNRGYSRKVETLALPPWAFR